jgi:hypothetical protein
MADVSIYVALIAAFAGVTGAAIPQVAIVVRDVRQSDRDRRDHYDDAVRQACLSLLRAVSDLRTLVANVQAHRDDMAVWLADVDGRAAEAKLQATQVSLLVRDARAEAAAQVAEAADGVAVAVKRDARVGLGDVIREPSFRQLDGCVEVFRALVIATAQQPASAVRDGLPGTSAGPRPDDGAKALDP